MNDEALDQLYEQLRQLENAREAAHKTFEELVISWSEADSNLQKTTPEVSTAFNELRKAQRAEEEAERRGSKAKAKKKAARLVRRLKSRYELVNGLRQEFRAGEATQLEDAKAAYAVYREHKRACSILAREIKIKENDHYLARAEVLRIERSAGVTLKEFEPSLNLIKLYTEAQRDSFDVDVDTEDLERVTKELQEDLVEYCKDEEIRLRFFVASEVENLRLDPENLIQSAAKTKEEEDEERQEERLPGSKNLGSLCLSRVFSDIGHGQVLRRIPSNVGSMLLVFKQAIGTILRLRSLMIEERLLFVERADREGEKSKTLLRLLLTHVQRVSDRVELLLNVVIPTRAFLSHRWEFETFYITMRPDGQTVATNDNGEDKAKTYFGDVVEAEKYLVYQPYTGWAPMFNYDRAN